MTSDKNRTREFPPFSVPSPSSAFLSVEKWLQSLYEGIKMLYEKELLGTATPEALLNTIWLKNTVHFGFCGCKEHRDMCWGDVKLCKTLSGEEYLEFHEGQTNTRTGDNPRDVRPITPKLFSVPSAENDPVFAYKLYAEKKTRGDEK